MTDTKLIHDRYNNPILALEQLRARCAFLAVKGVDIDFDRFSWRGSLTGPGEFDPEDPEIAVVLDVTLDTLWNTFYFATAWACDVLESNTAGSIAMNKRDSDFALLEGQEFEPWTLRWVRMRLDTQRDKNVLEVRDPKTSPGCAIFYMMAQHPRYMWMARLEPKFWIPGLRSTWGCDQLTGVPYVSLHRRKRQLRIYGGWSGTNQPHNSAPIPTLV